MTREDLRALGRLEMELLKTQPGKHEILTGITDMEIQREPWPGESPGGKPILFDVTDPTPPCPHCGEAWHMAERADQCPSGLDKRRLYALEQRVDRLERQAVDPLGH